MIPMSEVELLLNQHMTSPGGAPEPTPDWARLRGYQVISETRRPWRTGRIWRLGEKELVARKYFPPPASFELADALQDRNPSELSLRRFGLGLQALQLTSVEWHRHWGRQ